jgi:hypothetical protein
MLAMGTFHRCASLGGVDAELLIAPMAYDLALASWHRRPFRSAETANFILIGNPPPTRWTVAVMPNDAIENHKD